MKLILKNQYSKYEMSFNSITQLCGKNISSKRYVIDSLCKHFSSEKYKEYEDALINNVEIDGEVPGRKQWECYRIDSVESIISAIQMNKGSILGRCMKEYVGEFDCQKELMQIDAILLQVFARLNQTVLANELVEIQYTQEDLFSMLQQTSIKTSDGRDIHVLNIIELLDVFIEIIEKQQELIPEKRLYIFENIDHLISKQDYWRLVAKCEQMSKESSVWFIFSTSLDGYVLINEETIESVNVFNEEVFVMPSLEHIICFLEANYPLEIEWNEDVIISKLSRVVHEIGDSDELLQPDELVVIKLINETNQIKNNWKKSPTSPEIQCLMDVSML